MIADVNGIPERQSPDWVMLGVPQPDGKVMIVASKDLTEAELRHEVEEPDIWEWRLTAYRMPTARIYLTIEMNTYVMVVADTYAEALDKLLRFWTPSSPYGEGQKSLPYGRQSEIAAA